MNKYYLTLTLICCMILMSMIVGCKSATTEAGCYPSAIAWDDIRFGLSATEVTKDELGKQLGEIKRTEEPMPIKNGDSNDAPVGSKLFQIKGIDTKEAIAIEKNGKFYRASQIGPLE
jgi:hypothetical protein